MTSIVAAVTLVAGLLIGLTGIGGVLVVPALTELAGLGVERAVAAALFGFLVCGSFAAFVHLRRTRLHGGALLALCGAAAVGAAAGAAALGMVPDFALRLFVAVLSLASGVHALVRNAIQESDGGIPRKRSLLLLGAAVGAASALSGTGGPVTLVPILLWMRVPVGPAITLGLAAQLPITLSATLVNAAGGRIDWALGAVLGAVLTAGTLAGAWLSARLHARRLEQAVGFALVGTGLWYGYATLAAAG